MFGQFSYVRLIAHSVLWYFSYVKKMTHQLLISICLVLVTRSHYYKSIYRNSFKRCSKFRLHSRSGLRFLQNDLQPGPRKILILVFCEPSAQEQVRNYLAPGCSNTQPLIPTIFSALTVIHKCSTGADIFSNHLRAYFIVKLFHLYINLLYTINNLLPLIYSSTR